MALKHFVPCSYFTLISIEKISKSIETDFSSDGKLTIGVNDEKGHLNGSLELGTRKIHCIITKVPPLGTLDEKASLEMWTSKTYLMLSVSYETTHRSILFPKIYNFSVIFINCNEVVRMS
ncbi:hypothetical protein Droror1_Dr00023487 [Drosera rotundifolia]